ncbi:hypothetical protein [Psychromonas hadalis]|uniref:hypothetical protein n=1 Tax=Psychromonas hadalis TaxID=211669 RepID=UPI0003B49573|nr:hypothetical protein [Psychromonas hadalis]
MHMTLSLDVPMLSIAEYAKRTGISVDSVKKQCVKGQLPFIQTELRGTRYINMVQLTQRCAEANADKAWN